MRPPFLCIVVLATAALGATSQAQRPVPSGVTHASARETAKRPGAQVPAAARTRIPSAPFRLAMGVGGAYVLSGATVRSLLAACGSEGGCGGPSQDAVLTFTMPLGAWLVAPFPAFASRCSRARRYGRSLAAASAGAAAGALVGYMLAGSHGARLGIGGVGTLGAVVGAETCRPTASRTITP